MLKRGIDQTMAWILSLVLASVTFGTGYGLVRYLNSRHAGPDDHGAPALAGHEPETGAAVPAAGHGETPAASAEPGHGEKPAEGAAHGDGQRPAAGAAPAAAGHSGPHWEYKGSLGPANWGALAAEFATCGTGQGQSPIDIDSPVTNSKLLPIRFNYRASDVVVLNNGHTIQANFEPGNHIEVDGERFNLVQLHFHLPSEHKIAGAPYDMEMHLVHKNAAGALAVVGVMFEEGHVNKALDPIWKVMSAEAGPAPQAVRVDPVTLLPARRQFYQYQGSLTTPPCSEGVRWMVMVQALELSSKQVDEFARLFPLNARPAQPVRKRVVQKSTR